MKLVVAKDDTCVLRFDSDEEIVFELMRLADEKNINAAEVSGIGSVSEVELGYYDLDSKEYRKKVFSERMEMVSLKGNLSVSDGTKSAHLHGVFSGPDYQAVGGHVHRAAVSATAEIIVRVLQGELKRRKDAEIGLNLLD